MKTTKTQDLDMTAAWMAATGKTPLVFFKPGDPKATFEMPECESTRQAIFDFATGTLLVNARIFAAARAHLYKQVKGVRR